MKKSSIVFLQSVLILMALGALAILVWFPHLEGRNVDATTFEIYFKDPFLAYIYLGSIPFFTAFYQAFKLLGFIGRNQVFSLSSVKTLGTIKHCAIIIIGFIVPAEAYLFIVMRGRDDIAGGVAMGVLIIFISAVVATVAAVFEKTLESAVQIKSENDLTV